MQSLKNEDIEDIYALSPLQKGVLVESLVESQADVYVLQNEVTFEEVVTGEEVRRAWEPLLERHSILRTEFLWEGLSEPYQIVRDKVELPVEFHNWRDCDRGAVEERYRVLLDRRRQEGLDLQSAPLLRVDVVALPGDRTRTLFTIHHLISDGWSASILAREFLDHLETVRQGRDPEVEPAPPFREYVEWVEGRDEQRARQFWREELEGLEALRLPDGRVESDDERRDFDAIEGRLADELAGQIDALANRAKVSGNVVYQA
ncbi:MAG: condensation domain-containing protein, partial [Bradymonadaceae bacterium]